MSDRWEETTIMMMTKMMVLTAITMMMMTIMRTMLTTMQWLNMIMTKIDDVYDKIDKFP